MPSIKEMVQIIDATPIDQAILLKGIHGIGKSEIISSVYSKKGYRVVTLFLGQASDAGDIIGLPDRQKIDGMIKTVFAPPFWWPTNEDENVLIFLDELNRGKPEVMQCIMDMVLNRKLNGRALPKNTRVIAAMNPIDDAGFYQVDELDPALLDRFNEYDFKPTIDEWLDWATETGVNEWVTSFISKNGDHLDPITDVKSGAKVGKIQASRRSWKRVSDIINNSSDIDITTLTNIVFGIIGDRSTAMFIKHIRENGHGLSAEKVITKFSDAVKNKLKTMNVQDIIHTNRQISIWLEQNVDTLKKDRELGKKYAKNIQSYLNTINAEAMAEFFDILSTANNSNKKWPQVLLDLNPDISNKFFQILSGNVVDEEPEFG